MCYIYSWLWSKSKCTVSFVLVYHLGNFDACVQLSTSLLKTRVHAIKALIMWENEWINADVNQWKLRIL